MKRTSLVLGLIGISTFVLGGCQAKESSSGPKESPFSAEAPRATPEEIDQLVQKLSHRDPTVREQGAEALANHGAQAKTALPALLEAFLKDEHQPVRHHASVALSKIGRDSVPGLVEALKQRRRRVREEAAHTLGEIGPVAKDAIPALIEALKDADPLVRAHAARALGGGHYVAYGMEGLSSLSGEDLLILSYQESRGGIRAEAALVVPALTELLKDEYSVVRWHAAQALGGFGAAAEAATPALRRMLEDKTSPEVVILAAATVVELGRPQDGLDTLIRMARIEPGNPGAKEKAAATRRTAVRTLGRLGPVAKPSIPVLTEALKDEDEEVRKEASAALKKIQAK